MYSLTVEHSLLCKAQMIPQMRDGNPTASVQRICRQLPLPLGEGRGEGLLTKPKILLSPSLSERTGKRMAESFLFLLLSYAPHPNPLPKGEGIYIQDLVTLD